MANYSAQFIHNYATVAAPLHDLTRKNVRWAWKWEHQKSFEAIKDNLRKTALLNYCNPSLKTAVVCDGSPVGISAMLVQYDTKTQKPRVVTYASWSLTDVERRYRSNNCTGLEYGFPRWTKQYQPLLVPVLHARYCEYAITGTSLHSFQMVRGKT
jgi:hypothetical protein